MYCTCSNKNNYEVIGLCDVDKFTKKLGPFDNKPWTEITLPAISNLDCNNESIEAIEKVYVNISITSTKIIDTPESQTANSEGLSLTGKKLLIDGFVCEKIVYTSLTLSQDIKTVSFKLPFCTFIVIEDNADIFNDKYCIKTCVEDVFISLIDCKTIFQNITLFLFAQKASFKCASAQPEKEDCTLNLIAPNPQILNKLPNKIIVNNKSEGDKAPVVEIEFDKDKKELIVNSTGTISALPDDNKIYFSLTLKENDNNVIKNSYNILNNENGEKFKTALNGQNFQNDDILEIYYEIPNVGDITNFPSEGNIYHPTEKKEYYKITPTALVKYNPIPVEPDLTNTIVIRSKAGIVSTIKFDSTKKQLVVTSSNNIPDSKLKDITYFSFKLKDNSNRTIKVSSVILSNENSENFKSSLNEKKFEFDDILELYYLDSTQILILDYPEKKGRYVPKVNKEYYRLTAKGLVAYNPPTSSTTSITLPNEIIINSNLGEIVSTILFDITNNIFLVKPTYKTPYLDAKEQSYITIKLKDENAEEIKKIVSFPSNSNGEDFFNNLNGATFAIGNFLEINYFSPSKIKITNYPNATQLYTPSKQTEYYKITAAGLVPYTPKAPIIPPTITTLPNTIKIKSNNGDYLGSIQFDSGNKRLIVDTTKEIPNYSEGIKEYFTLKLRNGKNKKVKIYSFITSNADGRNLGYDLNNFPFEFGDIIELYYLQYSNIEISHIPSIGQIHVPTSNKESYTITNTGLQKFTGDLNIPISNIVVNSKTNEEVVTIKFGENNKFIATASGEVPDPNPSAVNKEYFSILSQKNSGLINFSYKFNASEIADTFSSNVNGKDFNDLDYISLSYLDKSKILISNFEEQAVYNANTYNKQFIVDNRPIISNNFRIFNTILLINTSNQVIATIQFNIITKKLIVLSTNFTSGNRDFWTIGLIDSFNKTIKSFTIEQNKKADAFANEFNGLDFQYGYYITIDVQNKLVSTLTVTNFENKIVNNLPTIDSDISIYSFIITSNCLIRTFNQ